MCMYEALSSKDRTLGCTYGCNVSYAITAFCPTVTFLGISISFNEGPCTHKFIGSYM